MKTIHYILCSLCSVLLLAILASCSSNKSNSDDKGQSTQSTHKSQSPQWNVSIFLDLSHRITPNKNTSNPPPMERDLAIIDEIIQHFKKEMVNQKAYRAKGRLKVFFDPIPTSRNINQIASTLEVDLSQMDQKQKKQAYDEMQTTFSNALQQIYTKSIETQQWEGADVWGFFKRKVQNFCILPEHRNILVILTDGYIYHEQSQVKDGNKYSYLLPSVFKEQGLRQNSNWLTDIQSKGFGLIPVQSKLSDLEVLVLEVRPEENHPEDYDLIEYTLGQWFKDMGIKKYAIYGTDLPANTQRNIVAFLK